MTKMNHAAKQTTYAYATVKEGKFVYIVEVPSYLEHYFTLLSDARKVSLAHKPAGAKTKLTTKKDNEHKRAA